jgi:hypothetical protein
MHLIHHSIDECCLATPGGRSGAGGQMRLRRLEMAEGVFIFWLAPYYPVWQRGRVSGLSKYQRPPSLWPTPSSWPTPSPVLSPPFYCPYFLLLLA